MLCSYTLLTHVVIQLLWKMCSVKTKIMTFSGFIPDFNIYPVIICFLCTAFCLLVLHYNLDCLPEILEFFALSCCNLVTTETYLRDIKNVSFPYSFKLLRLPKEFFSETFKTFQTHKTGFSYNNVDILIVDGLLFML